MASIDLAIPGPKLLGSSHVSFCSLCQIAFVSETQKYTIMTLRSNSAVRIACAKIDVSNMHYVLSGILQICR